MYKRQGVDGHVGVALVQRYPLLVQVPEGLALPEGNPPLAQVPQARVPLYERYANVTINARGLPLRRVVEKIIKEVCEK